MKLFLHATLESFLILLFLSFNFCRIMQSTEEVAKETSTFYAIKDETITGELVDFSKFRGKVCIIINSACKCGLAKSGFETIQKAKKEFPEIEVLLFPSALNKLINQEHETNEQIIKDLKEVGVYDLCTVFKRRVASQDEGALKWACEKAPGSLGLQYLKWNFTKFLVSRDGHSIERFSPNSDFDKLRPDIKRYIKESIAQ
ncbi:glutathione peroxidase [Nematocida sp. LUAm3]|nr:glutathione peroxidase [Nematocida sp. LUAm3]KAI5175385.1 glutathione peroxidase [Nematocida sp. LUAm2]KAI5177658.1 glutathione peroxidase [Nematocida sp. LUAm1]